jgi:hypothetical protein
MLWNLRAHLLAALVVGLSFTLPACGDDDDSTGDDDDDATSAATIDCSDSTVNPLKDSCLNTINTACDQPTGTCEAKVGFPTTTITYKNGVKITVESEIDISNPLDFSFDSFTGVQDFKTTIKKIDGTTCLTGTSKTNTAGCYVETTYNTTDGKTYVFCTTKEGESTLKCPDGKTENYTAAQETAVRTCTPGTPSSASGCKTDVSIPGVGGIPGL